MKKKIILDIIMVILYILVMSYTFTGVLFHEILSLIISGAFIVHLLFNYKWIIKITKNFKKVNTKTKLLYIVDAVILISFLLCIISGIYISRALFYFTDGSILMDNIHHITSHIALIFTIIHVIMHFNFFKKAFEKIVKVKDSKLVKGFTTIFIAIFTILASYEVLESEMKNKNQLNDKNDSEDSADLVDDDKLDTEDTTNDEEKIIDDELADDKPTVEEYLGGLRCDGCRKNCSLLYPMCGIGDKQADEAIIEYNELYGE